MLHKKQKSHGHLLRNQILPSFRSVGCKPCDFHRLKCSTNYNNFPKLRLSSFEHIEKEELNINLKHELKQKKKVISFQRKKLDFAVDKWKQRYGPKNNKQDENLPTLPRSHEKNSQKALSPETKQPTISMRVETLKKFDQKARKTIQRESFPSKTIITGNSVGMENRQETIKPMLDLKFKPNLSIKFNKQNQSQKIRRKQFEAIPERWEFNQDDNQYIGL